MAHKPPPRHTSNSKEVRRQYDKRRGSARERGYSTAWDKFAASLKSDPDSGFFWCRDCEAEGRLTPTQELHHTAKVRDMVQREVEMFDTSLLMVNLGGTLGTAASSPGCNAPYRNSLGNSSNR